MIFNSERGKREGWGGIPSGRFEDDAERYLIDFSSLICDKKTVFLVTDEKRRSQVRYPVGTCGRFLQQCFVTQERKQLLRIMLAGQRPKACTGATG